MEKKIKIKPLINVFATMIKMMEINKKENEILYIQIIGRK